MLKTQHMDYRDDDVILQGYCAYEEKNSAKKPAVLVCPDWSGKNEFACKKADKLAELGYVGFAIDMYGKGITGNTKEEKSALIAPFIADRTKLLKRVLAAFDAAKKIAVVDTQRIAAIGFCFGGLCALDLARGGADIKGVVSFHGILNAPENSAHHTIKAKVLALHGFDDPMVTPDQVMAFGEEMTHAKVDWQLTMYGNAMHAFTNPQANDPGFGTVYNKHADSRSWLAMKAFLEEVFAV